MRRWENRLSTDEYEEIWRHHLWIIAIYARGNPRGVVANVVVYDILVTEFELQSRYYAHFWTNALGKRYKPIIIRGVLVV